VCAWVWQVAAGGKSAIRSPDKMSSAPAGATPASTSKGRTPATTRAGFWWLDLINLILIGLAFIDLRLSRIMGVRLDSDFLSFANSPKMMLRMARPWLFTTALSLAVLAVGYLLILRKVVP